MREFGGRLYHLLYLSGLGNRFVVKCHQMSFFFILLLPSWRDFKRIDCKEKCTVRTTKSAAVSVIFTTLEIYRITSPNEVMEVLKWSSGLASLASNHRLSHLCGFKPHK